MQKKWGMQKSFHRKKNYMWDTLMSNVSHFQFDTYCGLKHFRRIDPSIFLLFCRIWVVLTVGHQLPRVSQGLFTYCSWTKKQSRLDHCIFINQERKPLGIIAYSSTKTQSHLGSWHIHQPRNKATWDYGILFINQEIKALGIMAYYSSTKKESHIGSWH